MDHYRNRLGILVLMAFQIVLLEGKPGASQQTEEEAVPASNEMHSRKVLVERAERLQRLCIDAFHAKGFSAEARAEARELVRSVLQAERGAVASIEAAISLVEESR